MAVKRVEPTGKGKKLKWMFSAVLSFLCCLMILKAAEGIRNKQESQLMAERWSAKKNVAQISAFFSRNANVTPDTIINFEHTLDNALKEASITSDSENPDARLWADAYSASGQITLEGNQGKVTVDAIGIGGDFFLFHPLKLKYGSYFSGNDMNKDYCVIDEEAAWKLFGSSNVAGMLVYVDDSPLMIAGVVERPEGRFEKAAGLDDSVVYVAYELLDNSDGTGFGKHLNIEHYEIVMPNPVSGFALQKVESCLNIEEREVELVQNTNRYSPKKCFDLLRAFGTRSMNGKAILYPYWENIARGYEDVFALLAFLVIVFALYTIIVLVTLFVLWWRHKGWTIKSVCYKLKDRLERLMEKNYAKRQERKAGRQNRRRKNRHTEELTELAEEENEGEEAEEHGTEDNVEDVINSAGRNGKKKRRNSKK